MQDAIYIYFLSKQFPGLFEARQLLIVSQFLEFESVLFNGIFIDTMMYTQVARTRHDPPHIKALANSLWSAIQTHQNKLAIEHNSLVITNKIYKIKGSERGTKEAELTSLYDPWWRNEQWRYELYHYDTVWEKVRRTFPGVGTGAVLFGIYWIYDKLFGQEEYAH